MSTWIHVTNLPLYYDEYGLQDIFSDIGQIIAMNVTKNEMILKSTGFVQFSNPKHAKLAASKKDQTVIGNSAIRVYLIWMSKEDLSTIKVENIPLNISTVELENNFIPYGSIVDITICKNNTTNDEKQDNNNTNNETYALISYCRVDYALQAVQEMNNTILGFGNPLTVNLVNPDARNLKWKRNSFEYKIIDIPPITHINSNQNQNYNRKHHRHHHHHHNNNNNQQHHNSNPNIIIVNNIGSIHNNNDDSKHNDLLHPSYPYNKHRNRRHNRNNNNNNRYTHNNNNNNNNYEDDINNYHHHRQYRSNRNNNKRRKPRKYRGNNTRNNISSQSTLLGPLHNESNGQYRTYSVTPSPTRSNDNNNNNNNNNNYLNVNQISLQRMNSADSNSSNSSVQSVPNYNIMKSRGALESYGFPSKQIHQTHHSPQPYMSSNNNNNNIQTPVSPASTSGLSTPSTTHSMPTPTPPNNITYNNNNMIHRSKTPTPLFHHNNIQTPTKSSTTPISALNTPPLPIPIPQIMPNMNIINSMNAMTINNIQNINNLNSHMNGIISPTSLMFPNLDTINKSPQSQTSPIVITPSQHNLLMQQQQQIANKNTLSPPNNTQSNFIYNSSPTLQGPFNNNIQPQKRFVFNNNTNNINNIPENNNNKKNKKSHNWTPKEEELGNKLYQIIRYNFPQRATKIVGMLLTANTIKDIEWMLQKPHILMAVANDYNQKQQKKELNKK